MVGPEQLSLRNVTYRLFADLGRAPAAAEVADALGWSAAEVEAGWRELQRAHALVLDRDGGLLMASPFSAIPTVHRVRARDRWWYANCGWDAFGICAALGADGQIETRCPDCGQAIAVGFRDQRADDASLQFHCLVPAARWYEDIVFT